MKTTPHTIFIYAHGTFLRIVRGEHPLTDTTVKPRVYATLTEALEHEHKPRIRSVLERFPPDRFLDRRLKAKKGTVKVTQHRSLADAIKSRLFLYAQAGYDSSHREVAYIYHRSPSNPTGLTMARSGPIETVRKLLKKYKKPLMRNFDYQEKKKPLRVRTAA